MKKYNIGTGVVFLLLAVLAYMETFSMSAKFGTDHLGPAFWPRCLCIALGVFSALLILEGLLSAKGKETPAPIDFKSENVRRVLKIIVVMVAFGAVTGIFGIYVGILLMMPSCMYLLGERNKKAFVFLSVAMCIGVYFVFGLALKVPLPSGVFFN